MSGGDAFGAVFFGVEGTLGDKRDHEKFEGFGNGGWGCLGDFADVLVGLHYAFYAGDREFGFDVDLGEVWDLRI